MKKLTATCAAIALIALSGSVVRADECEDPGYMEAMLVMIAGRNCQDVKLTASGEELRQKISKRAADLGGAICSASGMIALSNQLMSPELERAAAANDEVLASKLMCAGVIGKLKQFSTLAKVPDLTTRR